jgi:hypothetical protein
MSDEVRVTSDELNTGAPISASARFFWHYFLESLYLLGFMGG